MPREIHIYRQAIASYLHGQLIRELEKVPYRPCPHFLGVFGYRKLGSFSLEPSSALAGLTLMLSKYVPEQPFNTIFLQSYPVGSYVRRHRDPLNNVGKTVIAVLGGFTGAHSFHGDDEYQANPGDVIVQDCTIDGVQGEWHSVDPVLSGHRYCVILNTIYKEGDARYVS